MKHLSQLVYKKVLLAELMVGDDACLTYSTTGTKIVSLSPSTSVDSKNPPEIKNYYRNNNERTF
jgi:hypothetical protein